MTLNAEYVVIHCSASPPSMDIGVSEIDGWHRARGFRKIGYHHVIRLDGSLEGGRREDQNGAHCKHGRMNSRALGVCYVGGVNEKNEPADTRTEDQKVAMFGLLKGILERNPRIKGILGHRDVPGVAKACPSFDVAAWLVECGLDQYAVDKIE